MINQISVFLENKPGSLMEMTRVLGENNIDMRAFSLAETSDFGIARLIVDDVYKTTTILRDAGFIHSLSAVLAVEIPDVPGGLCHVLEVLKEYNVNVEYMYAFIGPKKETAYMIFKVTQEKDAVLALKRSGILLLDQDELSSL